MAVADRTVSPVAPRYAGLASRLAAYLLDWLVTFIIACLVLAAAGLFLLLRSDMGRADPTDQDMVWFVAIASLSIPLWFALTWGSWAWYGRSAGKLALNLRIVTSSGNRPGFARALLRLLVYAVEGLPLAAAVPAAVVVWMLRGHLNAGPILAGLGASLLLPVFSAVLLWRDRYHRSMHDVLSGTRVIVDRAELVMPQELE